VAHSRARAIAIGVRWLERQENKKMVSGRNI